MNRNEVDAALDVETNLEGFVENAIARIESAPTADHALVALSNLNLTIAFAASRRPAIVKKLGRFTGRLKAATAIVAARTAAASFSLTVGFPWGISVGLTWDTPKYQVATVQTPSDQEAPSVSAHNN